MVTSHSRRKTTCECPWNPSAETLYRHRNPLFGIDLRPEYLLPDELHTMHLGVFQMFVHTLLWDPIICERLKAWVELSQRCKKEKDSRTRPIYEMPDFSTKNLGSSRELKAKAAELGTLLFFAIDIIEKHKGRMSIPTPLLEAGKAPGDYMDITRSHGLRLPNDRLIASYLCFLHARERAGIQWKPEVHLAVHVVLSAGRFGNPRLVGNWIDESDNRYPSLVASIAAAPIWHKRIPSTFAHASGPSASSTTKKPKH